MIKEIVESVPFLFSLSERSAESKIKGGEIDCTESVNQNVEKQKLTTTRMLAAERRKLE